MCKFTQKQCFTLHLKEHLFVWLFRFLLQQTPRLGWYEEEEGGSISQFVYICFYGGRDSALSAWNSRRTQLSLGENRAAAGAFHLPDPPGLHPLVSHHCRRPPAAPQTCQTCSSYILLWCPHSDGMSNRKQATERHEWWTLSWHPQSLCRNSAWKHRKDWRHFLCLRDSKKSHPGEKNHRAGKRCSTYRTVLDHLHAETSSAAELPASVRTVPPHGVRPGAPPPPESEVGDHQGQLQGHRKSQSIIQRNSCLKLH